MAREDKSLTDLQLPLDSSLKDSVSKSLSYSKINKLIVALYMVTDIMDRDEPLRLKLRTLGADVVSDIHTVTISSTLHKLVAKIEETLYFLNLGETMNLISAMNAGILKNEFYQLKESVLSILPDLQSAFTDLLTVPVSKPQKANFKGHSIGHRPINLGIQKAGNFMKVLSNKVPDMSNTKNITDNNEQRLNLKKKRKDEILKVIRYKAKTSGEDKGLTITDIVITAKEVKDVLEIDAILSCGEKTLQRELVALVKENILVKTGSKRWSRYAIPALS